jgi:putative FmdB family regulatory protein
VPIYDYACSACGHVVEVIHGINDPGPHFCPNCGVEGSMRKRIVTSAVHFKGSGWAKKDRSSASASAKSKSSSASSPTSSSSSTDSAAGTESTPAKTAEPAASKSGDGD